MVLALALMVPTAVLGGGEAGPGSPAVLPALGKLPLRFELGEGEAGTPERFIARGPAYHLAITPTETFVSLQKLDRTAARRGDPARLGITPVAGSRRNFRLEFIGAAPSARISGETELPGRVNYFLGDDPARWRTGVPTFARVRVADLYPGISLVHYGNQEHLEYDFVVGPGRDPSAIAIRISGADKVAIDERGDLVLSLGEDEIRQPKPLIYQDIRGIRKHVGGGYVLADPQTVRFEIAAYDQSEPLVIDPILSYSTYYGGLGLDAAWGVAVDASGFVYVAGESMGGLPITNATLTNRYGGTYFHGDAFVAKFDNAASQVIYLTYIGGALDDVGLSLAVDEGGSAYVTGYTDSIDFPRQSAIFNRISGIPYPSPVNVHPVDGFVTKLGPSGTNLVYSTYLGGDWVDVGVGIAVDASRSAYVAGYTESTNFPTANVSGGFTNYAGARDVFVTKFSPEGTNLVYSMYLGGKGQDEGNDVAADLAGRAFVTGVTASENFPVTTNALQPALAGGKDAFVTVVGVNGTNLDLSTYLGGAGDNAGYRLALDAAANIYLTGTTKEDTGFPATPGGWHPGGVYRSGNGGADWAPSSSGLQSLVVYALAVDPTAPTRVYSGTSRGLAWSTDGGTTWGTVTSVPTSTNGGIAAAIAVGSVLCLAIDPIGSTNVYAGTGQGLFKHIDAGTNTYWTNTSPGLLSTRALAVDPVTPAILYAGNDLGVFRTTNAAGNWSSVNNGLGNIFVRALAVDPVTPTTVYAATAGGVYRTTTSGAVWHGFNLGLQNLATLALAIDPVNPATVYVGTEDGVFKSVDAGTNWSAINAGLTMTNKSTRVFALAIDPLTPAILYAGTTNGLFKSVDGGTNWNSLTTDLPGLPVLAVQPNIQSPNTVYAGTSGTSVFGREDAFLTKLGVNPFSVTLGGGLKDEGWDVTVDAIGQVHLVGSTTSKDFPTTNTAGFLSATNAGESDVFVAELGNDGNTLNYSAYFGGGLADQGFGIAVDSVGNVYIVGETSSLDFPTRAALQGNYRGSKDGFLARINNPGFQPVIDIQSVGEEVRLSWSVLASDYKLQSSTNLLVTNGWVNVAVAPVPTNLLLTVSQPATNRAQFFRLANP